MSDNITGDHAEESNDQDVKNIAAASKQKIVMDTLPKTVQDILNLNIRRFDGKSAKEAEDWLRDISQWRNISKLPLMTTFDILLTDEAQLLWTSVKGNTTEDAAHKWFVDTFTIKKSFSKKLMELASLQQKPDERFATFEIRTMSLLKEILSSNMTEEELLLDLLKDRVRDQRLKDTLITKPNIQIDEARALAKILEANEVVKNNHEVVYAVEQKTYANVTRNKQYYTPRFQQQVRQEQPRNTSYEDKSNNHLRRPQEMQGGNEMDRRPTPAVSLKDIAKRRYDIDRGIKPQQPRRLSPGDCFCCGNQGHMRHECPLKGKCLLCGKDNHNFRQCHLLSRRESPQNFKIACVQEDEESSKKDDHTEEHSYDDADNMSYGGNFQDLDGRKNSVNLIGSISSVGLRA